MSAPQDITEEQAEAIADAFEASFLTDAEGEKPASNPLSVKRGSLSSNPLEIKGRRESNPLRKISPKNTGKDALAEVFAAFRFDWVQGVIPNSQGGGDCIVGGPEEGDAVARGVRFFESIGLRPGQQGNGGKGYRTGLPFTEIGSKEKVASIASGSRTGGMPNITMSGGRGLCEIAGPLLIEAFPGLRTTRIDCALDISAPDAFEIISAEAVRFCRFRKMSAPVFAGKDTPEKGITLYVGSRESQVYLRIYQKGLQLISEGTEADPDWVRLEFVFQNLPSAKKVGFAKLTPGEMVRAFVWPRQFIAAAAKVIGFTEALEKAEGAKVAQEKCVKTLDTTAEHGVNQYGKTFARLAAEEIIRDQFGGDIAAAQITPQQIAEAAGRIFKERLLASGKVESVLECDRLHTAETPQQRAEAYAARQQADRLREMNEQARAANRLALIVRKASKDAEAAAVNQAAADRRQQQADEAGADIEAIKAEWAHRQRQADLAAAMAAAAADQAAAQHAHNYH